MSPGCRECPPSHSTGSSTDAGDAGNAGKGVDGQEVGRHPDFYRSRYRGWSAEPCSEFSGLLYAYGLRVRIYPRCVIINISSSSLNLSSLARSTSMKLSSAIPLSGYLMTRLLAPRPSHPRHGPLSCPGVGGTGRLDEYSVEICATDNLRLPCTPMDAYADWRWADTAGATRCLGLVVYLIQLSKPFFQVVLFSGWLCQERLRLFFP